MTPLDRAAAFIVAHGRDVVQHVYHDGDCESGPYSTTSFHIRLGKVWLSMSNDRADAYVTVPNTCSRDDWDPCVRMVSDRGVIEQIRTRIASIRDAHWRAVEARAKESSYAEA